MGAWERGGRLEGGCGDEGCWEEEESLGGCAPWEIKKLGKEKKKGRKEQGREEDGEGGRK